MLILFTIGEKVIRYVMRNKQGLMITKSFIVFGVLTKITNNQILTIMEQEPILNEHNLAESESKANPICFAEPKQGHELNAHNKQEYPPMHTAEHILNQTMVRMFGCPRSRNAHIEKKKSKCDYLLPEAPTEEQVQAIATTFAPAPATMWLIRVRFRTSRLSATIGTRALGVCASGSFKLKVCCRTRILLLGYATSTNCSK